MLAHSFQAKTEAKLCFDLETATHYRYILTNFGSKGSFELYMTETGTALKNERASRTAVPQPSLHGTLRPNVR